MIEKKINKTMTLFLALVLSASVCFVNIHTVALNAAPVHPELPVVEEVVSERTSTVYVSTPGQLLATYRMPEIARIVLKNDIELPANLARALRTSPRGLSLEIDGKGHTLKTVSSGKFNDESTFPLDDLKGETATFHLKNINVWSKGTNFIEGLGPARSKGWSILLENTVFDMKGGQQDQVHRVVRAELADLYLRGKVRMLSSAENVIVDSITVEPKAEVYGAATYYDTSTWWILNPNAKGLINVGQNAKVSLSSNKQTYPVIYSHWREINVHQGATLIGHKPGGAVYAVHPTPGVSDKYINVFDGGTLEGRVDGGSLSVMNIVNARGHVYGAPGSSIVLTSDVKNSSVPVLSVMAQGSTVEVDKPAALDLRNTQSNGPAIRLTADTQFKVESANVVVWNKGAQQQTPTHTWYNVSFTTDSSGKAIATNNDEFASQWQAFDYSRITAFHSEPPRGLQA